MKSTDIIEGVRQEIIEAGLNIIDKLSFTYLIILIIPVYLDT